MLRKTLITLTAVAALGVGSAAMAHGPGGGGGGGGFGGGAAMRGVMGHPMMMRGATTPMVGRRSAMVTAPMARRVAFHDHFFHHRFHNRFFAFHHRFHNRFFAFGFGVPYYSDYGAPYTDDDYSMADQTPQTVVSPAPTQVTCQHSEQAYSVPSKNGGTAQVTILRC